MNNPSGKDSAATARPVEVTIGVKKFRDVLSSKGSGVRGTEFVMKLGRRDRRAEVKGDNLYIKRPGAPIRFTITSAARDKNRYYPAGITFLREGERSTSDEQRLGFLNFPQPETRVEGRTVLIVDTYKDEARVIRYKFSVIIQRGSDGKIGIIDPGIVHESN